MQTLTEAAELADHICKADVGNAFQLTADIGRDVLATHMPRFDISGNQRHDGVHCGQGDPTLRRKEGYRRYT